MLTALCRGIKVQASGSMATSRLKAHSAAKELTCPLCGGYMLYCHGQKVSPYFRHIDLSDCIGESEPDTREHVLGKTRLFEWLQAQKGVTDVQLEPYLADIKRVPDMSFVRGGKLCVLEYQCDAAADYEERHKAYMGAGIKDYWVLGVQKYKTLQKLVAADVLTRKRYQDGIVQSQAQVSSSALVRDCAGFYDAVQDHFVVRGIKYFDVLPYQRVRPNTYICTGVGETVLGNNFLYSRRVMDVMRFADKTTWAGAGEEALVHYLAMTRPNGWIIRQWHPNNETRPVIILERDKEQICVFKKHGQYQFASQDYYKRWQRLGVCAADGDRLTARFLKILVDKP